ncbi:MAG: cation-translocating P-type ATPase [Clostridiaceae bacterium]|nr:cation-translocating P-type ATPase [Clostridiaceae bacterium]
MAKANISIDTGDARYSSGLAAEEAKALLEKFGYNTISGKRKTSAFKIFIDQFTDFMVMVLLAATAISAFMGEMTEAFTIIAIVIINAILGFIQEYRIEKTLEALKSLAAPLAKVVREGRISVIPASHVVPRDLILLEAGDRIPADAVLMEASNLAVDESLLTGESIPVEKSAHENIHIPNSMEPVNTGNKENMIFMGTMVTRGKGKAIVYATGMKTEMGKIAGMIQDIEDEQTPLQKKLERLGKYIVYTCIFICAVVSVTGILRGEDLFTMLLAGISLAVAAVPEGLPAVVTVSLALGVQRMLKKNALIRKLPAVETLGCASIICTDKTGTLTENKMTVRKIYAGESIYEVTGIGYNIDGDFLKKGKKVDLIKCPELRLALQISALCNNARIGGKADDKYINGINNKRKNYYSYDPTEVALLVAAAKGGLTREILEEDFSRHFEIPFDSDRKCMSVICRNRKNENFIFTKGAPDIVIRKCNKILTRRGIIDLTPEAMANVLKINDSMAMEALRVLGVSYKQLGRHEFEGKKHDLYGMEEDMVFVGLLGMIDPPREEAKKAIQTCKMAGIKPVMITGDHKTTAMAIARELDMLDDSKKNENGSDGVVLTGDELDDMSDKRLMKVAGKVSVYARVSPRHKLRIVKTYKKLNHVVAMTGDGVNDAPAVKEADIGVSMGIMGTDVTKEASSMILMDDNFATIVAAIEEGRVIYSNIRKFIRYLLSCNIGEVLTMFLGMLAGLPVPLLPIQILWVNLVTDGLPAIALSLEPPEKDVMMRKPRERGDNIFSGGLSKLIVFRGISLGLCTLAVFVSTLHFTGDTIRARTGAFVTLVITQLIHVFECKSERKSIFHINIFNNIYLVLAVLCSFIMILSVVYIPFLQEIFATVSLEPRDWFLITGFSFLGPAAASIFMTQERATRARDTGMGVVSPRTRDTGTGVVSPH